MIFLVVFVSFEGIAPFKKCLNFDGLSVEEKMTHNELFQDWSLI